MDPLRDPGSGTEDSPICVVQWTEPTSRAYFLVLVRHGTGDHAVMCKVFPNTLSDEALTWFTSLKLGAIDSWRCLEKLFLDKFSTTGTIPKTRGDLTNIKQGDNETLLAYLECFKKTYDEIKGLSQDTVITCFEGEFRSRMLYTELQLHKFETIGEMFNVAFKVALAEGSAQEIHCKKREEYTETSPQDRRGKNRTRRIEMFTSLNTPKENLVTVLKEKLGVCDPAPTRTTNLPPETNQCSVASSKILATLSKIACN